MNAQCALLCHLSLQHVARDLHTERGVLQDGRHKHGVHPGLLQSGGLVRCQVTLCYPYLDNKLIIDIIPGQFVDGGEPLKLDQPCPSHRGRGGAVYVGSVI